MRQGIVVNGVSSLEFGLRMLKRSIGSPPKDEITERVPFSSVTYDFSRAYGRSFGERTLSYSFDFVDMHVKSAQERLVSVLRWLRFSGTSQLRDDLLPDYRFTVREPTVEWSESHGVYMIDVVFKAAPALTAMPCKHRYNAANVTLPDVDGDGYVDSNDAAMILKIYTDESTGEDSEYTDSQRYAADANRDGYIDASDSTDVLAFYSALQTGEYAGLTLEQAWAEYLNAHNSSDDGGGVY